MDGDTSTNYICQTLIFQVTPSTPATVPVFDQKFYLSLDHKYDDNDELITLSSGGSLTKTLATDTTDVTIWVKTNLMLVGLL